jgi:D-alanine-D-alanine ligase
MSKHVAVIMGGWSAEREISLVTGEAVSKALRALDYTVTDVDATPDLAAELTSLKPDIVFNALHGRWGEDGCVQGLLEMLGIPYTHSGVLASALAMDKPMAKHVFEQCNIPCAPHVVTTYEALLQEEPMPRPYVVKPINEGSSVGVAIIEESDNGPTLPDCALSSDNVMVEKYVPGRELACGVIGGRALDVVELRPKRGFYDFEAKYSDGITEHLMPAPLSDQLYQRVQAYSALAHDALQCKGISRADFRYDETLGDDGLFILEVNTQPGMTPLSLVPEMAAHDGMDFETLVGWMTEDASCPR